MELISRIHRFIPKECMVELNAICGDVTISDNNTKADMMAATLRKYGVKFKELGPGTNRYAVRIDGYVFKIAMDKNGIDDNKIEFTMSDELQPFVSKTYECNGLIVVSEYVTFISKSEFVDNEENIKAILARLADRYIFGDVGYMKKNFLNWGYRDNGDLVILDYGYIYKVRGEEVRCTNLLSDDVVCGRFLEYDNKFNDLVCPHCRRKYSYDDIRRRIDVKFERERVENTMKSAYCLKSESIQIDSDTEDGKEEEIMTNEFEPRHFDTEEIYDLFIDALEHTHDPIPEDVLNYQPTSCIVENDEDDEETEYDREDTECEYVDDLFDVVNAFGVPMLYTDDRLTDDDNIPECFSVYHIRDDGTPESKWGTLERNVFSEFSGSLIVLNSLFSPIENNGVYGHFKEDSNYDFTNERMTMLEYANKYKGIISNNTDLNTLDSSGMYAYCDSENDCDDEFISDPEDEDIPVFDDMTEYENENDDYDDISESEDEDASDDVCDCDETSDDIDEVSSVDAEEEPDVPTTEEILDRFVNNTVIFTDVEAVAEELSDDSSNDDNDTVETYDDECPCESVDPETQDDSSDSEINVVWSDPVESDETKRMREELAKLADSEDDDEAEHARNKSYKHRKNYR